jgi:excisionase family DNA binding protein
MSSTISANTVRLSLPQVCEILNIKRSTVYDRISRGLLRTVKDGSRVFVLRSEVDRYIAASPGERKKKGSLLRAGARPFRGQRT